jgi:hypothetical protein
VPVRASVRVQPQQHPASGSGQLGRRPPEIQRPAAESLVYLRCQFVVGAVENSGQRSGVPHTQLTASDEPPGHRKPIAQLGREVDLPVRPALRLAGFQGQVRGQSDAGQRILAR